MRVLVTGNGAREHALAWKLSQSQHVDELFIAPGNPGTAALGTNIPIPVDDIDKLLACAEHHQIDLTVVGPEAPLAAGIVDRFEDRGFAVAGPSQAAARIESSKVWAKEIMNAAGVPTARAERHTDFEQARDAVVDMPLPVVIKANGLAAGKGVAIAGTHQEAVDVLREMMVDRSLGNAADEVLLEEYLDGLEVSVFGITDGDTIYTLPASCDYKRALDGDQGPNTGGMGAYCPAPAVDPELMLEINKTVMQPTIDELRRRGIVYRGILFAGLILTADGPRVLEFNCRFGDPETQVILPLLDCDLAELLLASAQGDLASVSPPSWSSDAAVGVVMASGGYPGSYPKGLQINGLNDIEDGTLVFHAGTSTDSDGTVVTSGGRVLTVVATAATFDGARELAYRGVKRIQFRDAQFRTDIASREVVSTN
jgi:phosphoribosylamine---glycine ligase